MLGSSGRTLYKMRYAGVIIALAYLFLVMPANSSAFTVQTDIAKLVEKLGTEPHLEHFTEYASSDKEAIERALADTEFLDKEWAGRSLADFLSHYGITGIPEAAENAINVLEGDIAGGASVAADGGATTFLVGGEGLDAAATGLGVASVGAAVGTVAAGAAAFAGGYYIGTKLVQLFGDAGVATEPEPSFLSGSPIETAVWQRIHICSFHCWESLGEAFSEGGEQNEVNGEHEVQTGPTYGLSGFSENAPLPPGYGVGTTFYIFTARVSPLFVCTECYIGAAVGFRPKQDEGHAWPYGDPTVEEEREGCTETGQWAGKIAGWPPHIKRAQLSVGTGAYKDSCTPWEEVECPACRRVNKLEKYTYDEDVALWRSQSQMPVDFPKSGRTCHEGFTCNHTEVPEYPSLESLRTQLPEAFSSPHHSELNKFLLHYEGAITELPGYLEVPSCGSMTGAECKTHIEHAGFTNVHIDPLTWEHAHLDKPASAYVETSPHSGTVVETATEIDVITNPATMPLRVPAPHVHETATQYNERIQTEGFSNTEIKTRTEFNTNPYVGPDGVAGLSPAAGTPQNPNGLEKITIEENPPSAAAPEEENKIGPPSLPGFVIPHFEVECKGFPFGVPCWLAETVESWSASASAPEWGIENFTIEGHVIHGAKFQLSHLEPIMEKVRIAMLLFATIGLVLLFYRFARGGTPPSGSGTQDAAPVEPWEGQGL